MDICKKVLQAEATAIVESMPDNVGGCPRGWGVGGQETGRSEDHDSFHDQNLSLTVCLGLKAGKDTTVLPLSPPVSDSSPTSQ